MTPADKIASFVCSLPQELGDIMQGPLLRTLGTVSSGEHDELRTLMAVAVIDFFFAAPAATPAEAKRIVNDTGDPTLGEMAMRAPLNWRWLQQARQDWAELRNDQLSYEALHKYRLASLAAKALTASGGWSTPLTDRFSMVAPP